MFFCALSITASRSLSLFEVLDGVLGRGLHRLPSRCVTASSRSLTCRASSVWRLAITSPIVFTQVPSSTMRWSAAAVAAASCGSGAGVRGARDEEAERGDAQPDQQAGGDEEGGFHALSLRDSLGAIGRGWGFRKRTNREHIDRAKVQPLNRGHGGAGHPHPCRTSGCGRFPSRSPRSTPRSRSWSRTCSTPCTTRPASGSPRSRSASRSASSPWISPRRRARRSRRCSSTRRSSRSPTSSRSTRRAACRSRNTTRRSSGPRR